MDIGQFIKPEMVGFIGGIVVVLEVVKGILPKVPSWVWKVAVIVAGFAASLVDMWGDFSWRGFVVYGVTYAAGASLVYQTGKMVVVKVIKREKEK